MSNPRATADLESRTRDPERPLPARICNLESKI